MGVSVPSLLIESTNSMIVMEGGVWSTTYMYTKLDPVDVTFLVKLMHYFPQSDQCTLPTLQELSPARWSSLACKMRGWGTG